MLALAVTWYKCYGVILHFVKSDGGGNPVFMARSTSGGETSPISNHFPSTITSK